MVKLFVLEGEIVESTQTVLLKPSPPTYSIAPLVFPALSLKRALTPGGVPLVLIVYWKLKSESFLHQESSLTWKVWSPVGTPVIVIEVVPEMIKLPAPRVINWEVPPKRFIVSPEFRLLTKTFDTPPVQLIGIVFTAVPAHTNWPLAPPSRFKTGLSTTSILYTALYDVQLRAAFVACKTFNWSDWLAWYKTVTETSKLFDAISSIEIILDSGWYVAE